MNDDSNSISAPAESFSLLNPTGKRELSDSDLHKFYYPGEDGKASSLNWSKEKLTVYLPTSGDVLDGLHPDLKFYAEFYRRVFGPMVGMSDTDTGFAPATEVFVENVKAVVDKEAQNGFSLEFKSGPAKDAPKENVIFIAPMIGFSNSFSGLATGTPDMSNAEKYGWLPADLYKKAYLSFLKNESDRDEKEKAYAPYWEKVSKPLVDWEKEGTSSNDKVVFEEFRKRREEAKTSKLDFSENAITDDKIEKAYRAIYEDENSAVKKPRAEIIKEFDERMASEKTSMVDVDLFFSISYPGKSFATISQDGFLGEMMASDPTAAESVILHEILRHALTNMRHMNHVEELNAFGFYTLSQELASEFIEEKELVLIDKYTTIAPWAAAHTAPNEPFERYVFDRYLDREVLGIKSKIPVKDDVVFDMNDIYRPGFLNQLKENLETLSQNKNPILQKIADYVTLQAVTVDGSLAKSSIASLPSKNGSINTFDNNQNQVSWVEQDQNTEERFRQYVYVKDSVDRIICPTNTINLVVSSRTKDEEIVIGEDANVTYRLSESETEESISKTINNQDGNLIVEIPVSMARNVLTSSNNDDDIILTCDRNNPASAKLVFQDWAGQNITVRVTGQNGENLLEVSTQEFRTFQHWVYGLVQRMNDLQPVDPKTAFRYC